jgi:enoyl-CoA hydratase
MSDRSPGSSWLDPKRFSALSQALLDEFSAALRALAHPRVGAGHPRGGTGVSARYDLGAVDAAAVHEDPVADRDRLQGYVDSYSRIWDHPKPVIAAIHGFCLAGGTQMCTFANIAVVRGDRSNRNRCLPSGAVHRPPLATACGAEAG